MSGQSAQEAKARQRIVRTFAPNGEGTWKAGGNDIGLPCLPKMVYTLAASLIRFSARR
jgi:hypothetical protein